MLDQQQSLYALIKRFKNWALIMTRLKLVRDFYFHLTIGLGLVHHPFLFAANARGISATRFVALRARDIFHALVLRNLAALLAVHKGQVAKVVHRLHLHCLLHQ